MYVIYFIIGMMSFMAFSSQLSKDLKNAKATAMPKEIVLETGTKQTIVVWMPRALTIEKKKKKHTPQPCIFQMDGFPDEE